MNTTFANLKSTAVKCAMGCHQAIWRPGLVALGTVEVIF